MYTHVRKYAPARAHTAGAKDLLAEMCIAAAAPRIIVIITIIMILNNIIPLVAACRSCGTHFSARPGSALGDVGNGEASQGSAFGGLRPQILSISNNPCQWKIMCQMRCALFAPLHFLTTC